MLALFAVYLSQTACAPKPAAEETVMPASTKPAAGESKHRFTGVLHGGVLAIGAETTGWALERDDGTRLDVDVSRAADDAAKLDGQRVVIEGTETTANWLERGPRQLLIA